MQVTYQLTHRDFLDGFRASRNKNVFSRWAFRFGYVVAVSVIALAFFGAIGIVATRDSRFVENLMPLFVATLAWGAFVRAVDQKNVFALFTSSRMFIPVPKRAFTPDQLTEFRQLLQQKIKSGS